MLGLRNATVLNPEGTDERGRPWGLLRIGEKDETTASVFAAFVKETLGCPGLRYVDGGRPITRVAVGGGACAGAIRDVADAGCDAFVTADVKYNQFWDAHNLGLNLIDATHFATENPVCAYLKEQIAAAFPEVSVKISETHRDCMKFF